MSSRREQLKPPMLQNEMAVMVWIFKVQDLDYSDSDIFDALAQAAGWSRGEALEVIPEECPYALFGAISAPDEDDDDWDD